MFFNDLRPHQGLGNQVPTRVARHRTRAARIDGGSLVEREVECTEFLGGLLKSYSLAA
jgi:hypothetical protein